MLNRLVIPATELDAVDPHSRWPLSLIDDAGGENEPFALPAAVQAVETKSTRAFTRVVYRELPLADIDDGLRENQNRRANSGIRALVARPRRVP